MKSMTKVEAIPLATLKAAHALGLGDVPRVPRQHRTAPKAVNMLPYVPVVNPLLIAVMGFEDAKAGRADRRRARGDGAPAQRGHGCRRLRLVGPALWDARPPRGRHHRRRGAERLGRDADAHRRDVARDARASWREVLGERGEGFIALSMAGMPRERLGALASSSGAPVMYQAMPRRRRDGHRMPTTCSTGSTRCRDTRSAGSTARASRRTRRSIFTFDYFDLWGPVWNEFTGPDLPKATKLANMADPAIREKLRSAPLKYMFIAAMNDSEAPSRPSRPIRSAVSASASSEIADATGQHVVDVVCDIVVADGLRTIFRTPSSTSTLDGLQGN
jgi:N-acyl-D-amino-acid deacylase